MRSIRPGEHKHISPKLASGKSRVANYGALPEHVKHGLRLIAARENKSVSRVLEEVIYKYFGITPPAFVGGREIDVINPQTHLKVIKKISTDKSVRSKAALSERATTILEREKRAAS